MIHDLKIPIAEIFGPTIQGEGSAIGMQCIFIRTGGCDSRCDWCDSKFTWDAVNATEFTVDEIIGQYEEIAEGVNYPVILTGGNPAMYHNTGALVEVLKENGVEVHLETQGTIAQDWFKYLDHLTISPKPPSSGFSTEFDSVLECINAFKAEGESGKVLCLKVVVAGKADYDYAVSLNEYFEGRYGIFLQPCNPNPEIEQDIKPHEKLKLLRRLTERCLQDQFTNAVVLPQLHNYMWGNQQAV